MIQSLILVLFASVLLGCANKNSSSNSSAPVGEQHPIEPSVSDSEKFQNVILNNWRPEDLRVGDQVNYLTYGLQFTSQDRSGSCQVLLSSVQAKLIELTGQGVKSTALWQLNFISAQLDERTHPNPSSNELDCLDQIQQTKQIVQSQKLSKLLSDQPELVSLGQIPVLINPNQDRANCGPTTFTLEEMANPARVRKISRRRCNSLEGQETTLVDLVQDFLLTPYRGQFISFEQEVLFLTGANGENQMLEKVRRELDISQ